MLTLVIYPHPMLQRACRSLTKKELAGDLVGDRGLKDLVNEMLSMMVEKKGVGLAAPQVGLPIRLLVMMGPDGPLALANPRLENVSKDMVMGDEGCLSTPGLVGQVRRFREVIASGEGFDGGGFRPVRLHLTEMFARIFQHEHDHLGGILFLKRAEKVFGRSSSWAHGIIQSLCWTWSSSWSEIELKERYPVGLPFEAGT